jgi:hypothetical protein
MRTVPSPPTAPIDTDVYLVLDDFGEFGIAFREAEASQANEKSIIQNMLTGQYSRPDRVVAFNIAEGWSRDVSEDIARAIANEALKQGIDLPESTAGFVDFHIDERWPLKSRPELLI